MKKKIYIFIIVENIYIYMKQLYNIQLLDMKLVKNNLFLSNIVIYLLYIITYQKERSKFYVYFFRFIEKSN